MSSLASLSISIALLLAAAGVGRLLSGFTRSDKGPASERLLIDTSVGLGALSLVVFALASLQLLRMPWALIAAAAVVVGTGLKTPAVLRDAASVLRTALSSRSPNSWFSGALLLVLAIAALVPALAPPSMGDWDSLAYHLTVPKLYLQHGGFYYIDFMSHSNFPFLMEMLYTPGVALGLPAAAKLMHYWTGVLLVLAVVVMTRRHLSPKAAPMAAVAIAGMPIVLWEATTAYIDLATALYTMLAAHLLLNYLDTRDRRWLIGCAIAAGFAASTKMTGLMVAPILAIWLLADSREAPLSARARAAAVLLGIALLVCAPWYLKTLIYTGSPVYPFFYSIFGGRDWTAQLASNYTTLQQKFGMGHGIAHFLTLPYDLTFRSDVFYDRPGLYVGPLFLVAVPFLAVGGYRSRKSVGLLLFFLAQVAVWFVLTQQSRYLIPAFAVLAALVGGVACADDRLRLARKALYAVLVLTAFFALVTAWFPLSSSLPVVLGAESQEEYLSSSLDVYRAQAYINEHLPPNAKVALFGDTRGFYLDRDFVWADPGHNTTFTREYDSIDAFVEHLRRQGVTHAMVNFGFLPPRDKASRSAELVYEAIEEGRLVRLYPSGDLGQRVAVYEVR